AQAAIAIDDAGSAHVQEGDPDDGEIADGEADKKGQKNTQGLAPRLERDARTVRGKQRTR
ncbi:MAG: hypothetical protein ACOYB4_05825, partial [Methyloceanibacter sp.]